MGKRENVDTTVDGRVMFDLLPYMFRNHKLSSYSLNSVCAEFLGMQKEDVHHSIISELQQGTDEDRRRLAVYCIKDSYLVIRLMWKLAVLINYIEMARVCGVPLDYLLNRGPTNQSVLHAFAEVPRREFVSTKFSEARQQRGRQVRGRHGHRAETSVSRNPLLLWTSPHCTRRSCKLIICAILP